VLNELPGEEYDPIEVEKEVPWYVSGVFTVIPDTLSFKIWVLFKSILYLCDLYILSYSAAFSFDTGADHKLKMTWFYSISGLQIIDIILRFFTAVKLVDLNPRARRILKYVQEKKEEEQVVIWAKNNYVLSINYVTNFFIIDFLAVFPSLIFVNYASAFQIFQILRLFKIQNILNEVDKIVVLYRS
jgi:hypothetical protein